MTENCLIIDTGRPKSTVSPIGLSKAGSHTGNGTNHEIGRKTKSLTHIWINRLLDCELLADPVLSAIVSDEVTGVSKRTHRIGDVPGLVLFYNEFAGDCSYRIHMSNILNIRSVINPKHKGFEPKTLRVSDYEIRFLSRLKAWASSEVFCEDSKLLRRLRMGSEVFWNRTS